MTYIKNTIARLEDWLNDLPQDSTFCKVSNRVKLLNKTIARHAEKNIETRNTVYCGRYAQEEVYA